MNDDRCDGSSAGHREDSIPRTRMTKEKLYSDVHFSADTLREAIRVFRTQADTDDESDLRFYMTVDIGDSKRGVLS